jgi:hypothetical protein
MTLSPSFLAGLRRVLRPLVRLLVARGLTYPMLAEILKETYVDVAENDFRLDGKPATDSRVSLLSGVHRKDVRKLRGRVAEAGSMPESVALGAQLVAAWTANRDFRDGKGRPRPLPRLAAEGGERSFESLVESVSRDIRPRSVLDEWLRLGIVTIDQEDRVVLRTAAFVPRSGGDEKAFYFAHNLHDHVAAAAHNLGGEGTPFLERSVHYDSLDPASLPDLARLAETAGMKALQAVNRKAMESEQRDEKKTGPKERITFGVYFFHEPRR